jgi:hypothetical protein
LLQSQPQSAERGRSSTGRGLEFLPHPFDKLQSIDSSPRVNIVEAELNRLERFLPLFLSLILDFLIHEGLVDGEIRSTVGEFLLDESFEGLEVVDAFGSHDWITPIISFQNSTISAMTYDANG